MRKVLAIVAYVDRAVIIAMSSISRQDVMKKASTIRQAVGFWAMPSNTTDLRLENPYYIKPS